MSKVSVVHLSEAFAKDSSLVEALVRMVNDAYNRAETGIWAIDDTRTSFNQMASSIALGRIVIAKMNDSVCGCIELHSISERVWGFGMLTVDPSFRRQNIGGALVAYCEEFCRKDGALELELELLVPVSWKHPEKEWLRAWYTGLGYRLVGTRAFSQTHSDAAANLKTEAKLEIYRKEL